VPSTRKSLVLSTSGLAGWFGEACGRGLLIVNLLCLFSVAINFFNYFISDKHAAKWSKINGVESLYFRPRGLR